MARKAKPSRHYIRARRGAPEKGTKHLEKLHVKRGDTVRILSGEDKGSTGEVMEALPAEGKVVVKGINRRWKHLRRSQENPQGGRIEREFPIPACKVRKVEG